MGGGAVFTSQISASAGTVGTPFHDSLTGAGCTNGPVQTPTPAGCGSAVNYSVLGPVAPVGGVCPPQDVFTFSFAMGTTVGTEIGAYSAAPVASSGSVSGVPPGQDAGTSVTPSFTPTAAGCFTYIYPGLGVDSAPAAGDPKETILVSAIGPHHHHHGPGDHHHGPGTCPGHHGAKPNHHGSGPNHHGSVTGPNHHQPGPGGEPGPGPDREHQQPAGHRLSPLVDTGAATTSAPVSLPQD